MTNTGDFGSFPKQHREFFNALEEDGWEAVEGFEGIETKVLSGRFENASGAVTRITRWAEGTVSPGLSVHDWCEEVFIFSGTLSIGTPGNETQTLQPGTYAVRPPHVSHGPFFTTDGCVMLEFLYYPPG
ncbi:MAG: cupin domain-containing protein [Rhodospirillales bacterium]|nr:cupin domain-containing protein [Rhodospirillales bacterium]MBO6786784.1 cupin domain-containing protein [Rhodospirillales bacterium]